MSFEMICASVQGASHIRKNIPCEDYGMKYENEHCRIFVLGDGHGDTNCPRSSIGSEYICKTAVECLCEFEKNIRECNWTEKLFDTKEAETLVRQLIMSIIGKWAEKVNEEYLSRPLSEAERSGLSKKYAVQYSTGKHIAHIYGTTMIAGLLTDRYLLLIHQGDGRCVVFDRNGEPSQPVPWDEKCMANITTSVCDKDAVSRCRYKVIDLSENPVIACFSGSDGVEDSFSSFDSMYSFYRMLIMRVCEDGTAETEKYLMEYLPEFSAKGSADDTTVCGIIDIEAAREKLEKLSLDSEIVNLRSTLKNANERIPQMKGKLDYLKSQCDKIKEQILKVEKETEEAQNSIETKRLKERLIMFDQKYQEAMENYHSIERALSEVRAEHYRFSGLEMGYHVSIWENRYASLYIELSKKNDEIENIKSSMNVIGKKIDSIQNSFSEKRKELNTRLAEAEKEYTEYRKKYEEIVSGKTTSEKRLSELTDTKKIKNNREVR